MYQDKLLLNGNRIKGIQDIGNLKEIAVLLNTSIDFLLDNDSNIDKLVIKEPINLAEFIKIDGSCKQDAVVLSKFKDADFILSFNEEKEVRFYRKCIGFYFAKWPFSISVPVKR